MNIKELRTKLGLSQQQLADQTGIPKSRIGQWEIGKGKPKSEDKEKLVNFFTKEGVFGSAVNPPCELCAEKEKRILELEAQVRILQDTVLKQSSSGATAKAS